MRIVSGKYGGRRFDGKLPEGIRPTTDSARETIFNLLNNLIEIEGTSVLDLFAGSGALGFESLSRGAAHCTFIDTSRKSLAYVGTVIEKLGLEKDCYRLMKSDALRSLAAMAPASYDIIFSDPPYGLKLTGRILQAIESRGVLRPGGIVVSESGLYEQIAIPENWEVPYTREFSSTRILILKSRD